MLVDRAYQTSGRQEAERPLVEERTPLQDLGGRLVAGLDALQIGGQFIKVTQKGVYASGANGHAHPQMAECLWNAIPLGAFLIFGP
jgi:hypothetical protein